MTTALAAVGMTPPPGSVARYAHAADRLAVLRKAWEDAGSPATAVGSREQTIADPLLAELRLTEASVTTLAEVCGIRSHPGRFKQGDHRAPDRKATLRVASDVRDDLAEFVRNRDNAARSRPKPWRRCAPTSSSHPRDWTNAVGVSRRVRYSTGRATRC
jgi:hypothetical protein